MSSSSILVSSQPAVHDPRRSHSGPPQITDAFPNIHHARVEVIESGVGLNLHRPERRVLIDGAVHVPCSNPYCVGGGVLLLTHLHEMLALEQDYREVRAFCAGSEFFHNVTLGTFCTNAFHLAIRLEFR